MNITILDRDLASQWLKIRGFNSILDLVSKVQSMESCMIPADAARRGALAHDLADEMASSGDVLVSVLENDVWGGPECEFVFDKFVQTGVEGEPASRSGLRTYIVRNKEYLYGMLSLASFYSWGIIAINEKADYMFLTDHDDWIYIMNDSPREEFSNYIRKSYLQ